MSLSISLRLGTVLLASGAALACASAPAAAPPRQTQPFEEKMRWILQLEDERQLRTGTPTVAPAPVPPRGRMQAGPAPPPPPPDLAMLVADTEARIRRRAALAIGRVRLPDGIDPLLPLLAGDQDPEVRQMAAFALGLIGDARAADALVTALADPDPVVQGRAAEALGLIGHRPAAGAIGAMLHSRVAGGVLAGIAPDALDYPQPPPVEAARLAMYALVRLTAYDQLATALLDANGRPVSRWWPVAYAFQRVGSPQAAPALRALLTGDGQMTRAFAARGLGVIKDRESTASLLQIATSVRESVALRIQAVRALGAIGNEESAHLLAEALRAPPRAPVPSGGRPGSPGTPAPGAVASPIVDRHLQLEVAAALGQLRATNQLDLLLDLASDTWPAMRAVALTSVAQADPDTFVSTLSGLDPDVHWSVRAAVATALGTLDAERAEAQLATLVTDSDLRVVPSALQALVAVDASGAPALLLERLQADDFVVRHAAAVGLGKLKPAGAAEALARAYDHSAERDSTYVARAAILAALHEVNPGAARPVLERALADKDWAIRLRAAELLTAASPEQAAMPLRPAPPTPVPEVNALDALIAPHVSPIAYLDTELGMIQIELAVLDAPRTVANFIALARKGYFNATPIHRVVPDFVVQDGDPRGDGEGGPGYTIRDEINQRPYLRGTVGMALDWADTGGSQFFITHSPQPHLDGRYTVFGRVTEGMDIVDRLTRWSVIRSVRVWDGTAWVGQ